MSDEIRMRWIRVKYMCMETHDNVLPRHQLQSVRSDGQQFAVWIYTDGENENAIKRDLFDKLNTHIDDPAMPPTVDEDGVSWPNQISPDDYKGAPGWEEIENARDN